MSLPSAENGDMARSTRSKPEKRLARPANFEGHRTSEQQPKQSVSPRWLACAILVAFAGAAFCGYLTLCLLFYQGQWQMLFHPSRSVTTTPASVGLAFDDTRFDVTDTGVPQLDGWWIPADPHASYSHDTILYLHDGRGSLSDSLPQSNALHVLGINVFAFDYRGYGRSIGSHPTERSAVADSAAAWKYLTGTRRIPARAIVVFGDGVGADFAASVGAQFTPAGLILEDPSRSARQIFSHDARARILPLFLLQNEQLDPLPELTGMKVPLLLLDRHGDSARTRQLFQASSNPKSYRDLRSASDATFAATMRRFLDEVLRR